VNSPPVPLFPLLLHLCLFIVLPSVTALFFKLAPMSQSKYDCFSLEQRFFYRLRTDAALKEWNAKCQVWKYILQLIAILMNTL
jgi:hypothetical protein